MRRPLAISVAAGLLVAGVALFARADTLTTSKTQVVGAGGVTTAPVSTASPAGTEAGLYVRVVSQPAGGSASAQGNGHDGGYGWDVDLSHVGGAAIAEGQAAMASSIPVVIASNQSALPVSGTFFQATQPVSIAATVNASCAESGTWTVQPGNTANSTAWKVDGSAATQPVSGTFWQATQPVSGTFWQATQPVSGTVTANAGTGTLAVTDTALELGQASSTSGQKGVLSQCAVTTAAPSYTTAQTDPLSCDVAGALRVNISAQSLSKLLVTPDSVALPANQSVNVSQINGVTTLMGSGATGTGSIRVTPATDSPTYSTANGAIPAQSSLTSMRATAYGSSPTAVSAGNNGPQIGDLEGREYVNTSHPRSISCFVSTTATTSTQITGCEVVASNSIYITSVTLCGDIANATANAATLQSGTSTTCTGPHILFACYHPALSCCTAVFPNPIKATVAEGLCILDGVTGTKKAIVTGYVAP